MDHILVVEDTDSLREVLCTVLSCEGYQVTGVASAEAGLEVLQETDFTLVLSDLKLPGMHGIEFLEHVKSSSASLPVIVMTAYGSIDIAVKAMKVGAIDFITKPFDPSMLCNLIAQVAEHRRIVDRELGAKTRRNRKFISQNPEVEEMLRQARKVAPLSSTVMILGESGTGKELIARYVHENSPRAENCFMAINCGSMPSELLESEFFGHEAGSFTGATEQRVGLFEVATHGTLFLDEIGNMPSALQMKLLRALQESEIKPLGSNQLKKVETRVIAATNCDIQSEIKKGNFREDLYYRLGVVILEIPPLRERKEDIELLANYFVKCFAREFEQEAAIITPAALKLLEMYHWPGNVRELENVIERAMIFGEKELTPSSLEFSSGMDSTEDASVLLPDIASKAAKEAEIEAINRVLAETRGNKSKAAKILGVSYKTLLNKVKDYGLSDSSSPSN